MNQEKDSLGKGISFMLLGSVLFAIADGLGKLVTENYPLFQVIWLRCLFGFLVIAAVIIVSGRLQDFRTQKVKAHFWRSVIGTAMSGCMLVGIKYLPLAEVTALVFATPLVVAVYSKFVLREPMSKRMFAAISLGFVGVLIVARPTPDHFHFSHLVMLGFILSSAYLSITARVLIKTESALTLNLYVYPVSIVLLAGFALRDWQAPDFTSLSLLFGVAFFATMALLSITKAVHYATPAKVTPFDYSRILWTVSIGYLFWGELPDVVTWSGIAIIIGAGLYIIRHGRRR